LEITTLDNLLHRGENDTIQLYKVAFK